jgi:hypothetical protein
MTYVSNDLTIDMGLSTHDSGNILQHICDT